MYRRVLRQTLRLALLATLIGLAVSACGKNGQQASEPRPLPEDEQALRPGEYSSEEFEPSLSFRVGKGWNYAPPDTPRHLHVQWDETGGIGFLRFQEIYEPTKDGESTLVDAPEDMLGWFQNHPYLEATRPEPVTVGGVKGEQFDVSTGNLTQEYSGACGSYCVDIGSVGSEVPTLALAEGQKVRVVVLEDVEGKTVTIASNSPATEFDRFAPVAQKVIDTVEWGGS